VSFEKVYKRIVTTYLQFCGGSHLFVVVVAPLLLDNGSSKVLFLKKSKKVKHKIMFVYKIIPGREYFADI